MSLLVRRHVPTLALAAVLVAVAVAGGSDEVATRTVFAAAVWWMVGLAVVLGIAPRERLPRAALVAGALFAGFVVFTGLSALWAWNPEDAFADFDRVALYLGLFVLAVLAVGRRRLGSVLDGLALGLVVVAVLALGQRCFPAIFPNGHFDQFLPNAQTRQSYPLNYWNGLAIFLALGFPLLLRRAVASPSGVVRGVALAPAPAMVAVIYLTSSRGGVATAVAGILVFFALVRRRVATVEAVLVAGAGSVLAIAALQARPQLVDGPLGEGTRAAHQGPAAAGLILLACVVVGVAHALISRPGLRELRLPARVGRAVFALGAVGVVAGIVAADPAERFRTFKAPPGELLAPSDFVRAHLLSGGGSGRWQFWSVAWDQFKDWPLAGRGADTYAAFWAQHAPITYFIHDAHSLYLQVLGELGIVGGLLLFGALGTGLVAAAARLRSRESEQRLAVVTLAGVFAAFLVGMGIDWAWKQPVVGAFGAFVLGLMVGPATAVPVPGAPAGAPAGSPAPLVSRRRVLLVGLPVLALAAALIVAQAIPWLARTDIRSSQAAAGRGDGRVALDRALEARAIQPWAASPYLQLALVTEQAGDVPSARRYIAQAIDRSDHDWQLWLVSARLATKAGAIATARRDYERARELNPRSPVFSS